MTLATPIDLLDAARGASLDQVDRLIGESLDALGQIVPYDLATVMQLDGSELAVRVARGALDGPGVRTHRLDLDRFPSLISVLEQGTPRAFVEDDHEHGDGDPFDGVLDLEHGHFCMVAPLVGAGGPLGLVTIDRASCGVFPQAAVELVGVFARLLALAIDYGEQSMRLDRLRVQLEEQNRLLHEEVGSTADACRLVEVLPSPAMRHVVQLARQVAPTTAPVLITGETGTGKDVLASAIHAWSARHDQPMVKVNCAALPDGLIESELFGHVRGAFSGATRARIGRFQTAHGGTLFLDEIGDLSSDLQAKLLRVLQDGTFEPVGSDRTVTVDVRVVAATNQDLAAAIADGRFREDLYYRLAVFPIALPPLRARREDIPVIARSFLATLARRSGRGPWVLTDEEGLAERPWPGNARELVNELERATILASGPEIRLGAPVPATRKATRPKTLEEVERAHIVAALRYTRGRLYGEGGAAEVLAMHPNTLASRMKKLGLGKSGDYR